MFWDYPNDIPNSKNKDGSRKKVFVGVSGGVDSSVSLAILKEKGFDVTGVFIKVYHPPELGCDWRDERLDAMKVCQTLDVPFLDLDLEKEYKQDVFDYMIETYKKGETPNPDVFCNRYVKFGGFWDFAKSQGADYVATGHYATRRFNKTTGLFEMHKGKDLNKDQTYFLYTLPQEKLANVLFPIGAYPKDKVRKLAKKYKLFTSDKKDSQGLCFVGKVKMKEFLQEYIPKNPGNVLNQQGEVIGTHEGAIFYTIGERHGFEIDAKHRTPDMPRMFVVAKNAEANTITVGPHKAEVVEDKPTEKQEISITNTFWISGESDKATYEGRVRYRGELIPCTIQTNVSGQNCVFESPHKDVAKGQSVVLYRGTQCIGGGTII